ncbi:hypothetical protein O181_079810 [Austropuccinia psidii MF-1]|uniref:Reverse transcriptase domain-containing protein n=1 Tax=Austropuccinia psidii MF-1 TaxID=1389203 RepID=A0A9Q3FM38_9BASI|nr:hypothetical protein [Austropuccinia psidii MF-1]
MSELPEKIPLYIMDSNESPSLFIKHYTKWVVDLPSFPSFEWDLFIIDSPKGEDLILEYDFLYHFNPIIDWKNGLITYHSSGILPSASNDFATAVNNVSLVGELKTPSLPASVHIPSIIPSQSLLPLRDEVFKQIKDFGKDVAISSIHLLQGDMDLPPWRRKKLCPHRTCDHHIESEGLLPPIGVIHSLSNQESETLRAYISGNVEKGFIRPSLFSTGAPVLFVKKKDGGLCLCVDYCKLDSVTRKNRHPVPPMNQLLTVFNGPTIFSKIDLRGASNHLRIKEGDEHLTAFRAKYGSYEHLIMPFSLTDAPASFQNLVNDIFAYILDVFVVVHLDDIMVFYSSKKEHFKHVASVFQGLRENTIVEPDASGYSLGAVLSQVNDSGKHPIAFDSHKLLLPKLNYETHDKERLGIVRALMRWRAFLLSLSNSFEVLTDHSSLQYFMSSKVLTRCQAHWAEFLSEFHFTITYCPGRLATLPDALSFWGYMYPERGVDFIRKNPQNFHQVIKQDAIKESIFFSIKVERFSDFVDIIQEEVWQDQDYKGILKQLKRGESVPDYCLEPQAKLLFLKYRVLIPRNEEIQLNILQKRHDSPLAGNPGQEKTLKRIKRDFYWAGMNQFIKDYVSSCQQCSRNKKIHHKKFGLLKPLSIPSCP